MERNSEVDRVCKSLEEIISDGTLNYQTSTFSPVSSLDCHDHVFVEFKRKEFVYNGLDSDLVTITNVTD